MSPPPTLPTPPSSVPSDRPPLSPRSLLRDLQRRAINDFPSDRSLVRFSGPRPSHSIPPRVREDQTIRRSTLNDPFFSILERAERRERSPDRFGRRREENERTRDRFGDRIDRDRADRMERSTRGDRPFDSFFSSDRVERRTDESHLTDEYNALIDAIRAGKEEEVVDGVIVPVDERDPEEGVTTFTDGEIFNGKNPERRTKMTMKATKRFAPDGSLQLVFARCEKTVEENGKMVTHQKMEHHFTF